jgi:S-adenosylmethionine synthetase
VLVKERSVTKRKILFTSESVTSGHPDKICDQIADAILDEALRRDPRAYMAVEATIKNNKIFIYGEGSYNSPNEIDYASIAKGVLRDVGYHESYDVIVEVSKQSEEINKLVCSFGADTGAGDQGIIFGYACSETRSYMPLSIDLAHKLAQELEIQRRTNANSVLLPDGKTQVCVEYEDESMNKIKRIDTILISVQHRDVDLAMVRSEVQKCIERVLVREGLKDYTVDTTILINPLGSFIVGGSFGDSGTTGRKIVVDTYGGHSKVGGGCFSSKDPSKVDRSAAYYARYVAKNLVASGIADRCEIQVSYCIGMEKPMSINVNCFGTNKYPMEEIYNIIDINFDFRPYHMVEELNLRNPIYSKTAVYGHFGREEFPWEKLFKVKTSI